MKELKIVFLVLAIGLSSKSPVTPKSPSAYYPNTFKGGIQTTLSNESAQTAVLGVEGKYEYYMQFLKFKLDYQKKQEHLFERNSLKFPPCGIEVIPEVC